MVEFKTVNGSSVRINPALVDSLFQLEAESFVRVVLSSGETYNVPGTIEEVDDKLTAHYTDVRYLAFVVEALCTHLKVEITPPSQLKVEIVPPTEHKEENPT